MINKVDDFAKKLLRPTKNGQEKGSINPFNYANAKKFLLFLQYVND